MQMFSAAGIYTMYLLFPPTRSVSLLEILYSSIDLSLPVNGSIDRDAPTWTTGLLDLYIATINTFSSYDNVLAYNIGNEVVTSPDNSAAAAYVKAAARDTKAYL
jgi:hypothetical protein